MKTLSAAQINLINKIGYTFVADTSLTLGETETLETLKLRFVRIRMRSGVSGTTYYELSKRGFALYEEMKAVDEPEAQPAETIAPTAATEGEITPEPTGPDHTETERTAMDTFDANYDYMSMTPKAETPVFKVGDKVNAPHGAGTITQIIHAAAIVRYEDGSCQAITSMAKSLTAYIDPRDIEIERLKAEVAALKAQLTATPMEELQRWHEGRSTYVITILSPSEDETYIFEDAFRTRSEAVLEGQRIRNESYRGWSIFVKEKYPDTDELENN